MVFIIFRDFSFGGFPIEEESEHIYLFLNLLYISLNLWDYIYYKGYQGSFSGQKGEFFLGLRKKRR